MKSKGSMHQTTQSKLCHGGCFATLRDLIGKNPELFDLHLMTKYYDLLSAELGL